MRQKRFKKGKTYRGKRDEDGGREGSRRKDG
jgi:hypothetical protein